MGILFCWNLKTIFQEIQLLNFIGCSFCMHICYHLHSKCRLSLTISGFSFGEFPNWVFCFVGISEETSKQFNYNYSLGIETVCVYFIPYIQNVVCHCSRWNASTCWISRSWNYGFTDGSKSHKSWVRGYFFFFPTSFEIIYSHQLEYYLQSSKLFSFANHVRTWNYLSAS